MAQYRKKPVVIDAIRFNGTNENEVADFVGENLHITPDGFLFIHTLEGSMAVSYGDYVIKGVRGEFYPCKPDIFEQTYESVESQKELDEVAKEIAYSVCRQLPNGEEKDNIVYYAILAAKSGAKWMAEQGETQEHIRKDALLEWANDNLLECEVSNDDTDYGRIDVYKKLIDKIKSL